MECRIWICISPWGGEARWRRWDQRGPDLEGLHMSDWRVPIFSIRRWVKWRFSDKKVKGSDLYLGRVTLEARRKYSKREALEGWGHREAMPCFRPCGCPQEEDLVHSWMWETWRQGVERVVVLVRGHVGLCFRSQLESELYHKSQCLDIETGILSTSYCLYFVFTNFM